LQLTLNNGAKIISSKELLTLSKKLNQTNDI
jgi:hypothetical protein